MDNIIVTITNAQTTFSFDIEAPVWISVERFKSDLYAALMVYQPDLPLRYWTEFDLICSRSGKRLDNNETIENSGIWNGDYLIIVDK